MSEDNKNEIGDEDVSSPIFSSSTTHIKYIKGDATQPIGDGNKMLIHCCNDIGAWGSGFVMAISKRWKEPEVQYRKWSRGHVKGAKFELGAVQFVKVEDDIVIGNMVGQKGIARRGAPPIRYPAIVKCLEKVRDAAVKNKASVHAPKFGSDRAGGKWDIIEGHIRDILCKSNISVTIYEF
jgi:hypothetical protein